MHRHFPMVRFGEFVYNIDSDMHARDGRAGKQCGINQSDVGPTLSVLSSICIDNVSCQADGGSGMGRAHGAWRIDTN